MKPSLSRSLASYKRTPKLGRGDKLGSKKRGSNILGLLATPGAVKYTKTPIKKTSIKVIKSLKEGKFKPNRVKIWKVSDTHNLNPPASFQYMNPASYGNGVTEVDSSLYYSSSENWNKKRVKNSKSSNRSSGRGNSAHAEKSDDNFINTLLHKNNEDVENQSSNVGHENQNLLELWGNKRIEQSLSKFSSHLILPANVEEVPENNNLKNLSVDNIKLR